MKSIAITFLFVTAAYCSWAQPARVPIKEAPPTTNTKPNNPPTTNTKTNTTGGGTGSGNELIKYSDPLGRFTISYPGSWILNDKSESSILQLTSPKENDDDDFRQNLNLQIEDMSGKSTSLDEYVRTNMEGVKDLVKGYTEVSSMFFNRNGIRAYEVVYKGRYGSMEYDIQVRQLFSIANNKAYVLTYISKADERDALETTANRIFNTFKF
ncbi:MAG: hypothetical protein ACK4E8_05795 [Lacibacter sp.]